MEYVNKIVDFEEYCKKCAFKEKQESEDPCFECLENPVREHSKKPVKFKEDKS